MNTTQKPQFGCANSSKLDSFQMEMWTNDQLQKLSPTNSGTTLNAISSLGLADGHLHSNSQDGQQTDQCGQVRVHASRFPQPEKDLLKPTSDTCGQSSSISSRSASLTQSLASRLQAQLATDGSMEYRQTWNQKVTPAGRLYWAHTASAHRTSDRDSTGWPTPAARDYRDTGNLENSRWRKDGKERNDMLSRVAAFTVETEKAAGYQLNPHFSRWLMGFPQEWCACAVTAMQSFPKSRRSSLKPIS